MNDVIGDLARSIVQRAACLNIKPKTERADQLALDMFVAAIAFHKAIGCVEDYGLTRHAWMITVRGFSWVQDLAKPVNSPGRPIVVLDKQIEV